MPALLRARRRLGPRGDPDRARARRTTARGVLNGQKVWTTNAQFASYGLLLARTDPDVPKHKGLTMFVVPMDAEGVTVRGLRQISGEAEFNEVFFDDVRLPADAVVRPGRRRLAHRADDADVRARDDRPRLRGPRLQGGPLRARARRRRRRARRDPERAPAPRRDRAPSSSRCKFAGYRTLTALPARPDPRPGGRPGEGHDRQRGDRGGRARRRRRSAPTRSTTASEWAYMISFLPGPEVGGRDRGDPAQHDRRARARPAARAAAGQGHPVQRAARRRSARRRRARR